MNTLFVLTNNTLVKLTLPPPRLKTFDVCRGVLSELHMHMSMQLSYLRYYL